MKKILIATTALVATAGFAAADVSLSGDARMGVVYDGTDLLFESRARAAVTLSGETDGGLAFGGSFDFDDSIDSADGFAGSAFVSGEFGKVSMGDVDGAAKAAVGQIDGVGLTGLADGNELSYVNGGTDADGDGVQDTIYPKPAALYEFSTNNFTFFAGAGSPKGQFTRSTTAATVVGGVLVPGVSTIVYAESTYSLGAGYAADNWSVAAGWETTDAAVSFDGGATIAALGTINQWVIGGSFDIGDFTVKANYGELSIPSAISPVGTTDQYGISGTWGMDAYSVTGYYARGILGFDNYGLGAVYDLGGGLSIKGGVARVIDTTIYDLGVSMSF